jgi:type II secretory pathway predicted ATPase ExeA
LAGRTTEIKEFERLLGQPVILTNLVLTGLRGVGKTVLLEGALKQLARQRGWLWTGNELSEAINISEEKLAQRLITDLSMLTSQFEVDRQVIEGIGFRPQREERTITFDHALMESLFRSTPGLASDKIKAVLEATWQVVRQSGVKGIVLAYDEAQNLADRSDKDQYPLSLLLDVFQSIQKKGIPIMLVLTGLPTLFPKLVGSRTFAERMFKVITLDKLDQRDRRDAIVRPISDSQCPVSFTPPTVDEIANRSGGYPYFIQFICYEMFEAYLGHADGVPRPDVTVAHIARKLDSDFFSGRWNKVTNRQRELLSIIASLDAADEEFTVQEISEASRNRSGKPFSPSHVNQMLTALAEQGLIFKNRHGKYSFAVPMLADFIRRQSNETI